MYRCICYAIVALLLLFPLTGDAARSAKPPSHEFRAQPHYVLAIATLQALNGNQGHFEIERSLFGEIPSATIDLDFDDQTAARLNVGLRFVIGFTDRVARKYQRTTELLSTNVHVIRSMSAGEAIAAASDQTIDLLSGALEARHGGNAQAHLRSLLSLIQPEDPFLARFAAAEILGQSYLETGWDGLSRRELQTQLTNPALDPRTRNLLLQVAWTGALPKDTMRQAVVTILRETPPAVIDGDMYWPSLLRTSLFTLGKVGTESDVGALSVWLRASHPALVEAALATQTELAPASEQPTLAKLSAEPLLHPAARAVVQRRLGN